jgi:hypothetical protein
MRRVLTLMTILCVLALSHVLRSARADEQSPHDPEKPVLLSRERLLGQWQGYDVTNGVAFLATFSNTVWLTSRVEVVELRMIRWDKYKSLWGEITQESPAKPVKLGSDAEFLPLAGDRLRLTLSTGFVLPWVPTGAVLERVKTNGLNQSRNPIGFFVPNPQGGANGEQPFGSDTNRTSAAAASRRSP